MEALRTEVRELHLETKELVANQRVSDQRLERIEEHVDKVQVMLFGRNGTVPGMIVRIDRMERIFGQMRWLLSAICTMGFGLIGKMVYDIMWG
jgi:hypothetical protein